MLVLGLSIGRPDDPDVDRGRGLEIREPSESAVDEAIIAVSPSRGRAGGARKSLTTLRSVLGSNGAERLITSKRPPSGGDSLPKPGIFVKDNARCEHGKRGTTGIATGHEAHDRW
jgi:hypothetical protein